MQNQKYCCLPLKRAFQSVLYVDMTRIVWGLIICAFLFQQASSLSLVITIADIIGIVLQASIALYISMRALQQFNFYIYIPLNNHKPIFIYRRTKMMCLFFNVMDRLVVPIFDCTLIFKSDQHELFDQYCKLDVFISLIITAIIWNLLEYYFFIIVKTFSLTIRRDHYRPVNNNNNRQRQINQFTNLAVVYEVVGIKPANRRGQLVYNPDRTEKGIIRSAVDSQLYKQPPNLHQKFHIDGRIQELDEINLINE